MKRIYFWLAVTVVLSVACGAQAATTMWLSQSTSGTPIIGDVNISPGASIPLYCFINSSEIGNTFEIMVGYDKSDATMYGVGKDTNDGEFKKLSLVSSAADISGSEDGTYFDVLRSALLDASGRESLNADIGGRPYGFVVRGATRTNAGLSNKLAFSFTLRNDMAGSGDSQYVVLSNYSGGNSFSSAWEYGTALGESACSIKLVNSASLPKVGTTNKAVLDSIMTNAVSQYTWVLWGKVSDCTSAGFKLDDSSGVIITVDAAGNSVANNDYVSVSGTLAVDLEARTATLTSQSITKHN